jgi:PAS domain S-box-containing protein
MLFDKRPGQLESRNSLKSSFTLWLCFAMLVTSLIVMLVDYNLVYKRNTRALQDEVEGKMARALQTLGHPLWLYDVNFIREFADILTNDGSVLRVTVIDERNRSLVDVANANVTQARNAVQWDLEEAIQFKGRPVGRLIMSFTNAEVSLLTRRIFLSDLIVLLAVLLSVLGTAWFLINRQIFVPLATLEKSFHEISAGDYSGRVDFKLKNELAAIATEFNAMVDQVQLREESIRESEWKYRNLIESSEDIIFTTDLKGLLIFMNPRFEGWTGRCIDDFIGLPFADMFAPSCRSLSEERFLACLRGEEISLFEIELEQKGGGWCPWNSISRRRWTAANI